MATLKFKSSYEANVYLSGAPPTRVNGMDISPFDWTTVYNDFNYLGGDAYVTSAIDDFSTPRNNEAPFLPHHGGTGIKCLFQELRATPQNIYRNELAIGTADNTGYPNRLTNLQKIYYSAWWYFPLSLDLNNGGWLGIWSYREYGNTGATQTYDHAGASLADEFTVGLYVNRNADGLYWTAKGNHYSGQSSPFEPRTWTTRNYSVPVPLGKWFHLEIYEERAIEHGVFQVWVDGVAVFNVSDQNPPEELPFGVIRTSLGNHRTRMYLSKLYTDSYSGSGHYPFQLWSDDFEIWDGIPYVEPPPTQTYTITITQSTGGTTTPIAGSYEYAEGTMITLTAMPDEGYQFTRWISPDESAGGITPVINWIMHRDITLTAEFAPITVQPCFIATAAYGSPLAVQLDTFRAFRDKILPDRLVDAYYRASPPLANWIAGHRHARSYVRKSLDILERILRRDTKK